MHSVFFWGSKFIERLSEYFREEVYRKGRLIDVSPVSDWYYSKKKNDMAEWRRELDEIWEKEKPEYLILDLYSVRMLLYEAEGHFITLTPQNVSKVCPGKIVPPVTFVWKKLFQKLDTFIDVIGAYFDKDHIILVKTHVPQYYVIDSQLRQLEKNDKKYSEYMQEMYIIGKAESHFIRKTGAIVADLTKYYFYEKEKGYNLTNYIYETECYQDIAGSINRYIQNHGEKRTDVFRRPDFSVCLKRYCKYYECTVYFEAFSVFLDKQNLLENMVSSAPKEFVLNHFEELLKLHNMFLDNPDNINMILQDPKTDVEKILQAYNAVMQGDYTNETTDYRILFHNEVVPQSLLSKIKGCCQEQKITDSRRIYLHNAGFYFACMLGCPEEEAMSYVSSKAVIQPVLIDVFGSCITRTCLRDRFTGNRFCAVNNYWFQVPAYEAMEHPVKYSAKIFQGELDVKDRCVKMQFDHNIGQEIEKSNAQWLIVDLFSLITPSTYRYHGLVYTDQRGKISRELGAERVDIHADASIMGNADEIIHKMIPWCEYVKRKYGNHIILVDVNYSPFLQGDDNVIYQIRDKNQTEKKSDFLMKAFDFVSNYLGCYCIKIACNFLSDEKGYLNKRMVHYDLRFYRCVFESVRKIIMEEPEQKLFDTYSIETRLERICLLLPENNPRFLRRYFSNDVDNWVLQLPVHLISKFHDQILRWYENGITDGRMLLKLYEGNSEYEELANAIRNMEETISCDENCPLPKTYKQYDEERFLQGIKIPGARSFTIKFNGNGADAGTMKSLKVVWGVRTKLGKNKFRKQGYQFAGWKAVRKSDGKTCYSNQGERRYFTGGGQKPGYEPYYYPDNCSVATLTSVDKDVITFFAQWEDLQENERSGDGNYLKSTFL